MNVNQLMKSDIRPEGQLNERDPEIQLLRAFEGKWQTKGHTFEGVFGPSVEIKGIDTYEWLAGNYFLVHKVDVNMGIERVEALEVIGYDPSTRSYPIYAFDNLGNASKYEALVKDDHWYFNGISERAKVRIENDRILASWEQLYNKTEWVPWMEINLRRL